MFLMRKVTKLGKLYFFGIISVFFLFIILNQLSIDRVAQASNGNNKALVPCVPIDIVNEIATQRNSLSQQLNEARMMVGQYQCQISTDKTTEQGGWCEQASTENGGEHETDMSLVLGLGQFLRDKVVASFGDGPGAYKREMLKLRLLKSYSAFDGAPFCEKTSEGRVEFMDLTIPQYGIPTYDWVISLEVAEHIPKRFEKVYLDNIFRHAREGIVLSWAIPGQGGLDHINNRPLEYVVDVMEHNGFYWDKKESENLQGLSELPWFKTNLNVYKRDSKTKTNKFGEWFH